KVAYNALEVANQCNWHKFWKSTLFDYFIMRRHKTDLSDDIHLYSLAPLVNVDFGPNPCENELRHLHQMCSGYWECRVDYPMQYESHIKKLFERISTNLDLSHCTYEELSKAKVFLTYMTQVFKELVAEQEAAKHNVKQTHETCTTPNTREAPETQTR
ncbi:hypothetical protein HOD08_04800, partial [bacterium]|nr:hypothetical protein [bacterium]